MEKQEQMSNQCGLLKKPVVILTVEEYNRLKQTEDFYNKVKNNKALLADIKENLQSTINMIDEEL